jgi:7-cyano-7-deazaguanine synthase
MDRTWGQRERDALDRHITGNYGEDQFKGQENMMGKAVVLHSGGQDSTTCLAWAIQMFGLENIYPLIIDYNQRHRIEIECAHEICTIWRTQAPRVLYLDALADLGGAALTDRKVEVNVDAQDTGNVFAAEHDLPSTFVPGRNMLFFTLAAAYGATLGAYDIVTGVCETDRAGYPDCRLEFVQAAREALWLALDDTRVTIHAPLIHLSKGRTFELAAVSGALDTVLEKTNTCYHGKRDVRHEWGYGCGACGACLERSRGWEEYKKLVAV